MEQNTDATPYLIPHIDIYTPEPLIETEKTDEIDIPHQSPPLHDTKIGITIIHEIILIDFSIKQIMILPSTSASITVYINTNRGQEERTLYMGTAEYLEWTDDAYLYGWIRKNIEKSY